MNRWRPPGKPSSKYITPEGAQKLNEELQHLWKVERPSVTARVAEAAAQGDRSENAEYIYGKKRLREIDSRIRFLTKRLDNITIVDTVPDDQDTVYLVPMLPLRMKRGRRSNIVLSDLMSLILMRENSVWIRPLGKHY
jgi:transcription elongation factor GreB